MFFCLIVFLKLDLEENRVEVVVCPRTELKNL
jgi:hypothetical protein